ncbi:Dcp1-like decapping family-like protein [Elsinoe fawcettii]|nr:Dcp1-like decapping family-like protein [Elsinoe fawcettii]
MPPRKPRRRPQQIIEASDYDSEQPTDYPSAPSHNQAPPTRTNEELNLAVLRRHSPSVSQILSVAGFACVYRFAPDTQTWVKTGVEGALFVCELLPIVPTGAAGTNGGLVERYGVVVLNRKGLNNFVVELRSQGDVDVDEEYVILQVGEGEDVEEGIYGLWIFCPGGDTTDREVAAAVITECAGRAEGSRVALEGQDDYEQGYEAGYENGFADGEDAQEQDVQQAYQPQYTQQGHQSGQEGGQQIDLLSLFGKATQSHQAQQPQQPQFQQQPQYQNGYSQEQQPVSQGQYQHGHPQPPTQQTQAQNLLSLFKR